MLAAFEAGGNRPQPQGLRASKSRKVLMLGVKPDGVPLGFKRCKRFLLFLSKSITNSTNRFPIILLKETSKKASGAAFGGAAGRIFIMVSF